jgi:AraC family transcriptional regulator
MQSIEPHRSMNGGAALCDPPALDDNEWLDIERFVPMVFRRPASLPIESESPTRDAQRVESARPTHCAAHNVTPDSAFSTGPSLEVERMLDLDRPRHSEVCRLLARQFFGHAIRHADHDGLMVSLTRYQPDTGQPWHTHEHPTLFILIRGTFTDRSWATESSMEPLSLVFHPTHEPHQSETGGDGAVGVNIEIPAAWLARRGLSEDAIGHYFLAQDPTFQLLSLRLLVHVLSPDESANRRVPEDVMELLNAIAAAQAMDGQKPAPVWLPHVERYLRQSIDEASGLRDAARAACVHPVYLARVFRQHYGCSVGEYIRKIRILAASRYAIESDSNLADAAHEARFADQSHFTRLFTREMGLSPKALLRVRATAR